MKVVRADLLSMLQMVSVGLSKLEVIEQSSSFVFSKSSVITYNDEISCKCKMKYKMPEGAVNADILLKSLQQIQEDTIDVSFVKGRLCLKTKNIKTNINMDCDVVLSTKEVEKPSKWKKLPKKFQDAMSIVYLCASYDDSQFALSCVLFDKKALNATDSFQVCRYPLKLPLEEPVMLKRHSVQLLSTLNLTEVSVTDGWVHFQNEEGLIVSCRKSVGYEEFPDVRGFMKGEGDEVTFPKLLSGVITRSKLFAGSDIETSSIKVALKKGGFRIVGKGKMGMIREDGKMEYKGKPMSFTIQPDLFVKICQREGTCIVCDNKMIVKDDRFTYAVSLESV